MDKLYLGFIAGFLTGVALCAIFPKIPENARRFIEQYKKKFKDKKAITNNPQQIPSQQNSNSDKNKIPDVEDVR